MMWKTLLGMSALFLWGCARPTKVIQKKSVKNSNIVIAYELGHSHYQFKANAKTKSAEISSWRDNKILEKKKISLEKYLKFADQVYEVIKAHPSEKITEECRTPFKISLVTQKEEMTVSGCRGEKNKATIGQVIKEGEFLFYK